MAAEARLQSRIHNHLKKNGWIVNKIMLCSMNGWPDTIAVKKKRNGIARVVFIEWKAKGNELEPLQVYIGNILKAQGAEVYMVDSWESFMELRLK